MKNLGTARRSAAALLLMPVLIAVLAACATVPALPEVTDRPRPDAVEEGVSDPGAGTTSAQVPARPPAGGDGELSPYDVEDPAIAGLDAALRRAVQSAADDADTDGIRFWVTSGWRSRAHQQRLLDEAVQRYGSLEAAERFVSTPGKSAHVRGNAVDIGPTDADSWLARHGSSYGLCQSFANEAWHFELAVEPGGTCPAPIPDSSYR